MKTLNKNMYLLYDKKNQYLKITIRTTKFHVYFTYFFTSVLKGWKN